MEIKFKIKIKEVEIELSMEELCELKKTLEDVLGERSVVYPIYPIYPIPPTPLWPTYPIQPWVTICSTGGGN